MKSILIGNGVNINFTGKTYTSRFILDRVLFNARANKYDCLFGNKVDGKMLEGIFKGFISIANKIIDGEFDDIQTDDEKIAIKDFKNRYKVHIHKCHDIMMEDWFLLIKLFFDENKDISDMWDASKQGFEQIILDAILNDGSINDIYKLMNTNVKRFFNGFDNIFTLNYDENIELLTKRKVMHLHGSFSVLADSENPGTVIGNNRVLSGTTVVQKEFEHCYCNALLNYSGELKYERAENIRKANQEINKWLNLYENNPNEYRKQLELIKEKSTEAFYTIETYVKNPMLTFGSDYHFEDFKKLSGTLHILGLSPNNDSHIFRCIDESDLEEVIFYSYGDINIKLPIKKPYRVESAKELWKSLKSRMPEYRCSYPIPNHPDVDKFINCFNAMSADPISKEEIIKEVNSIPQFEIDRLYKVIKTRMLEFEKPNNMNDMEYQFREISRIALSEGIYPSALFMLFVMNLKNE